MNWFMLMLYSYCVIEGQFLNNVYFQTDTDLPIQMFHQHIPDYKEKEFYRPLSETRDSIRCWGKYFKQSFEVSIDFVNEGIPLFIH